MFETTVQGKVVERTAHRMMNKDRPEKVGGKE